MERVCTRDNSSSRRSGGYPTAPFIIQGDPSLLTPNRRGSNAGYTTCPSLPPPGPQQSKSPFRHFERPSYSHIAILTVLCLITYPAFYALTLLAKDKSLFVVRLIVSAWCSGIGFVLGCILLAIGAQHLEAASESIPVWYWDSLTICFKQPGPP